MAVKQTKKLNDSSVTDVTTVNSTDRILMRDSSGKLIPISLANLKAAMMGGVDQNVQMDGVFIMYHDNSNDAPRMVKPHKWPSLQSAGQIADGVVVVEGGKILVVAPTESSMTWSSAAVSGGGVTTSDRVTALNDWAGKQNTAAQITHAECSSNAYAPGYCANYSRVNANSKGLTAGKWWLPSLGEIMMIYANMTKINYALSLISGATQLSENWYWTSTEGSAPNAWILGLDSGIAGNLTKASYPTRVRPVSAFIA
ncbi:MAG: hypothetical protein IKP06_01430 [Elusimicrobiaceae bacterium]|nr:hypothetical protein [Elusimicrobiaceae bacterium]